MRAGAPRGGPPAAAPAGRLGAPERSGRGAVTAREQLRGRVRRAAAAAGDEREFLSRLREGGLIVTERRGSAGDLAGYAVALPGDVDGAGAPVRFGGGKLAADLSLPKLRAGWAFTPAAAGEIPTPAAPASEPPAGETPAEKAQRIREDAAGRARTYTAATGAIQDAAEELRTAAPGEGAAAARAAAGTLAAAGGMLSGDTRRLLEAAGELYERAAQVPRGAPRVAGGVRAAARLAAAGWALSGVGRANDVTDSRAVVALLTALAVLNDAVAGWHAAAQRAEQAGAARAAAAEIRRAAATVRVWDLDALTTAVGPSTDAQRRPTPTTPSNPMTPTAPTTTGRPTPPPTNRDGRRPGR